MGATALALGWVSVSLVLTTLVVIWNQLNLTENGPLDHSVRARSLFDSFEVWCEAVGAFVGVVLLFAVVSLAAMPLLVFAAAIDRLWSDCE